VAPPAPAPEAGPPTRRVIPNISLPVGRLRSFDANVSLAFASVRLGGTEYRALATQITLAHGVLSLAPSSLVVPGGEVIAAGQFDGSGATPHAAFAMQAPNLAIAPLLTALQLPAAASGLVQVFANLTASGDSTLALAATVNGALGIAAVNGVIDGRALATLIRPAVHAAQVIPPELVSAAGQIPLHCLALRLDATHGVAAVHALVLDTSALLLQGTGSINFGQETLALALQPNLYLGETELSVPLTLGGTFAKPHLGKVGSVVINANPAGGQGLNGLFQSLVGSGHHAPPVSAACGPALLLARNGQAGPNPADGDTGLLGKPIDLLQHLLHGQ
jgi:AsmA protein